MSTRTTSDWGAFATGDDDGHDGGEHGADGVDREAVAPALGARPAASGGPCPTG